MTLKIGLSWINYSFDKFFKDDEVSFIEPLDNERYDLIIFPGGEDVDPKLYGELNTNSDTNSSRDAFEQSIFDMYKDDPDTKFLGICRGHQFINVLLGGKLIQDLQVFAGVTHKAEHPIKRINNGIAPIIYKNKLVSSTHHQGVIKPGRSLRVTSMWKGIIESCESSKIITVQWHPEFLMTSSNINFFNYIRTWAKK